MDKELLSVLVKKRDALIILVDLGEEGLRDRLNEIEEELKRRWENG